MRTKSWTYAAAIAALTIVAVVRVASTHRVFSATHDEPAHVSAGYEWFTGSYTIDLSHPPLARILCAFPLWLHSDRIKQEGGDFIGRTNDLLYRGRYEKNLARARRGILVLFVAAILGVAAWTRRTFSDAAAIAASALFTNLPPILGHAGVATTDLAVVAALPWAIIALERYYERPTLSRGALLGCALAFGLLAKFSFIVYFPPAAIIVTLMRWPVRATARGAALAVAVAFLVVWAGYRFEVTKATAIVGEEGGSQLFESLVPRPLHPLAHRLAHIPLPAVSLPLGVAMVHGHDQGQNVSYLLGTVGSSWWFYFPVVLFYKTPLPFLILFAWGVMLIARERSRPALSFVLIAFAILGVAMTSHINIGVRHVLPVYVPASAVAAYAVVEIWKRATDLFGRAALAALLAWLVLGVAIEHPDYLAWFNETARPDPSSVAVDSNLEWGQDGLRLARVVREIGIDHLKVFYATNIRLAEHHVDAELLGFGPQQGWIAVGEAPLRFFGKPEMFGWLRRYRPVRHIGKSVRLYYVP